MNYKLIQLCFNKVRWYTESDKLVLIFIKVISVQHLREQMNFKQH